MLMLYRIHWRAILTDATGQGTGLFPQWKAKQIVEHLNIQDRGLLFHWYQAEEETETLNEEAKGAPANG